MASAIFIDMERSSAATDQIVEQSPSSKTADPNHSINNLPKIYEISLVTIKEYQEFTLNTALVLLPSKADQVVGFLSQMLQRNRDPYLAMRVNPAIASIGAGNHPAARRWLEVALCYLQYRLPQ